MPTVKSKNDKTPKPVFERLEARISVEHKELFKKAAMLQGQSLTDFIVSCIFQEASRIVQEHETLMLSERDRRLFVETMLNPPKPTGVMRKAVQRHQKLVEELP
jgi:uncharacterized protein (DUF1778 family)